MTVRRMNLKDYLVKMGTKDSLFMLSSFLNKASIKWQSLDSPPIDVPSGIEGCMEFLEKNAEQCIVELYIDNGTIVGFDLKLNSLNQL